MTLGFTTKCSLNQTPTIQMFHEDLEVEEVEDCFERLPMKDRQNCLLKWKTQLVILHTKILYHKGLFYEADCCFKLTLFKYFDVEALGKLDVGNKAFRLSIISKKNKLKVLT